MRYTPVRCYVLLDLVDQGKLVIERNGALEPSIRGCGLVSTTHPFSEKRMLTAVADLHREGLIRFTGKAFAGSYTGKAEVTPAGRIRLDVARRAQQEFAELAERQAAERLAFEQKRAEELAAFAAANQVEKPARTPQQEAAERVMDFLRTYQQIPGVDLARACIIQKVEGQYLELATADLLTLCNTVLDAR